MGKINDKNFQLRLAFQDTDLRKPKHDEIMHWLDNWVNDFKNVEPFFEDRRERGIGNYSALDEESRLLVNESPRKESIIQQFNLEFKESHSVRREPWSDEPPRKIDYLARRWEKCYTATTAARIDQ